MKSEAYIGKRGTMGRGSEGKLKIKTTKQKAKIKVQKASGKVQRNKGTKEQRNRVVTYLVSIAYNG